MKTGMPKVIEEKEKMLKETLMSIPTGRMGDPIDIAGAAVGGIMAYEFERKMWKKISETVKKVSQIQHT